MSVGLTNFNRWRITLIINVCGFLGNLLASVAFYEKIGVGGLINNIFPWMCQVKCYDWY